MKARPPASLRFVAATVILPLMTETEALRQTVDVILRENGSDISRVLIIVCDRTGPESVAAADDLQTRYPDLLEMHRQRLPFLGGAVRDGFELSTGSHVIMMASDLETDPHDVKHLIAAAKVHPAAIITASRWRSGGSFSGYSPVKLMANRIFQALFSTLYGTRLTDLTFGFRLFPIALVQAIEWRELRHPFLLETIVKPLRLGIPVIEIPSQWRARTEGLTQNTFLRNFAYFRTGFQVRWMPSDKILRGCSHPDGTPLDQHEKGNRYHNN